ncbi:hypothetical protein HY477_02335 [Candidatus Uhrbacteria bacterium]|nr:hypothetical protein [Candidatus Uhrbacteria bacterium]
MSSDKKFHQGSALDKELRALYEEGGKLPDMSRLQHKRHRRIIRLLVALVVFFGVLAATSWAGFLIFGPQNAGGDVKLSFNGPEKVISGVPQEITLNYENRDREPLAFGLLRLRLPDNLVIAEINPAPDDTKRLEWNFGTLPAKSSGKITFIAIPFGIQDDKLEMQALISFKPANFNAEFQTFKNYTLTIADTGIEATLTGPAETTPGEELDFVAKLRNVTDQDLENLEVSLENPGSLSIEKPNPETYAEGLWKIGKLAAGEEQEFKFTALILSSAEGNQPLTFKVELNRDEKLYPLGQVTRNLTIKNNALGVDLLVNDTPHLKWARLGDELKITTKLNNRGENKLENITVKITATGELLNWNSAQVTEGNLAEDNSALFPKEGVVSLNPGQTLDYSFQVPVRSDSVSSLSPFIDIAAEVRVNDTVVRTPPLRLVVVSDLKLFTDARYFSPAGTPVGAGPLPMRVSEETEFLLRFRLTNIFHDLSNVVVTANLPQGVIWKGVIEVQGGRLTFDEAKREVRFEVNRMPVTTPELNAQFKVGVIPQETDRGKLMLLLNVARVEALDTISQTVFSTDTPAVSTALDADPQARGKGIVE